MIRSNFNRHVSWLEANRSQFRSASNGRKQEAALGYLQVVLSCLESLLSVSQERSAWQYLHRLSTTRDVATFRPLLHELPNHVQRVLDGLKKVEGFSATPGSTQLVSLLSSIRGDLPAIEKELVVSENELHGAQSYYRGMTADGDRPALGASSKTLGVRWARSGEAGKNRDIEVDANGRVHPDTGGLSVAPSIMSAHEVQNKVPASSKPFWRIPDRELGPRKLKYRDDPIRPGKHGFVEPKQDMTIAEYEQAIRDTRDAWRQTAVRTASLPLSSEPKKP